MKNPLGIYPKIESVDIPDSESPVLVRMISARERAAVVALDPKDPLYYGRLLAVAICDLNGDRRFKDEDASDLMDIPSIAVDLILNKWMGLNGIGKQAEKEKNS